MSPPVFRLGKCFRVVKVLSRISTWTFVLSIYSHAAHAVKHEGPLENDFVQSPARLCELELSGSGNRARSPNDYNWKTGPPSDIKTFWPRNLVDPSISRGSLVAVHTSRPGTHSNGSFENYLLTVSRQKFAAAPEIGGAFYLNRKGEEVGRTHFLSVGSAWEVNNQRSIRELPTRPAGALILVSCHTHPDYEIAIFDPMQSHGTDFSHPLSREDLLSGQRLSRKSPGIFVREEAVVPNGYFYHQTFFNGHAVRDPLLGQ